MKAILDGQKNMEYRSRRTKIRDRVYIYGSLKPEDPDEFEYYGYDPAKCTRGLIVGSVVIVYCTDESADYQIHLAKRQETKEVPEAYESGAAHHLETAVLTLAKPRPNMSPRWSDIRTV